VRGLLLLALVSLALVWSAAVGPGEPVPSPSSLRLAQAREEAVPSPLKDPKLSGRLLRLSSFYRALQTAELGLADPLAEGAGTAIAAALASRTLRLDMANRVQVWAHGDDPEAVAAAVQALGGQVERQDGRWGIVQAWVPVARLQELAQHPAVRYVEEPPTR